MQDLSEASSLPASDQESSSSSGTVSAKKDKSPISDCNQFPACQQFQTALDLLHRPQFRSSKFIDFLGDMLTFPSASHFSGAHHFVSNGGTFNNILGNYVVVVESSDAG